MTLRTAQHQYVLDDSLAELEQRLGDAVLRVHRNALVARAGLELLARQLFTRVRRATLAKTAPSATINRSSEAPPDYVVRGWRAWSIHYGDKNTNGSEQFEWHIKRTRRP